MNKIILISFVILPFLTNVLCYDFHEFVQKLQDIGKKMTESISKQCLADTNSEQMVCNKEVHDKYMNKINKLVQDITKAGQQGDTNKVSELDKQVSNQLCCTFWFSEDCMTNAVIKVGFEKLT